MDPYADLHHVTGRQLARRLGVNDRHVRRLVAERRIPFVKWGHLIRFDPVAIELWLEEHRQAPLPSA